MWYHYRFFLKILFLKIINFVFDAQTISIEYENFAKPCKLLMLWLGLLIVQNQAGNHLMFEVTGYSVGCEVQCSQSRKGKTLKYVGVQVKNTNQVQVSTE